jgi:hypothetical protein
MTGITAAGQLQYESRVRPRQAIIAGAAGVLLIGSAAVQLAGPHTNVAEITLGLILEKKRLGLDVAGALVQALGWLAVAWTLWFLFSATRARDAAAPRYIRYIALVGAPLAAIGISGYIIGYGIQANDFTGAQTYPEANHLMSAPLLAVFQVMDYGGELLLAVSFVLVSMQAMRVGLLPRFMGYLGIIAGILVLFVVTPVPIVQAYWLVALGVLFAGRWPSGTPPAWQTGRVERWPSSQELRAQRQRQQGRGGSGKQAPQGAVAPQEAPKSTRATTPKRKRKRRK